MLALVVGALAADNLEGQGEKLGGSHLAYEIPSEAIIPRDNKLNAMVRDRVAECTPFAREVMEAALAHRVPDAVEAAYSRSDLPDRR